MAECIDAKPRNKFGVEFAGNWISAETYTRSLRRRLMAILRMAYRVLGMRRKGLGLGTLGIGKALAVAIGAMSIAVVAWHLGVRLRDFSRCWAFWHETEAGPSLKLPVNVRLDLRVPIRARPRFL